jgi:hypothetical protein
MLLLCQFVFFQKVKGFGSAPFWSVIHIGHSYTNPIKERIEIRGVSYRFFPAVISVQVCAHPDLETDPAELQMEGRKKKELPDALAGKQLAIAKLCWWNREREI